VNSRTRRRMLLREVLSPCPQYGRTERLAVQLAGAIALVLFLCFLAEVLCACEP
jgi:hypothetical protein